jgi:hypothetical protein
LKGKDKAWAGKYLDSSSIPVLDKGYGQWGAHASTLHEAIKSINLATVGERGEDHFCADIHVLMIISLFYRTQTSVVYDGRGGAHRFSRRLGKWWK